MLVGNDEDILPPDVSFLSKETKQIVECGPWAASESDINLTALKPRNITLKTIIKMT